MSSHELEDMSWGNCVSDVTFLNNHFLIVTFFKDIFLWIFNLEQKKFFNHQKKIPCNLVPMILQTKVCVADITQKCRGHYIFGNTFFVIHFLVSVAQCRYVNFFCSFLSKNEAVKLLFTLFNMFYYNIIFIISCWPSIMQYQSDFFLLYWLLLKNDFKINFITSQVNVVRKKASVLRRLFCFFLKLI